MPFAYYAKLSAEEKSVYEQSDGIAEVPLPRPVELHPLVAALAAALLGDDSRAVSQQAKLLCAGLADALGVPPVDVAILPVRPRLESAELHGLYTSEPGERAVIRVWMRTARHRRVVAFRTFLRTLLHELCHHLDLTHFKLSYSFHTDGFFKRESSLFHQLVPSVGAARESDLPEPRTR